MKFLLSILAVLVLAGCTPSQTIDPAEAVDPNVTIIDAKDAGSEIIDPRSISRLGENCGPTSAKLCASGLSCQFEGTQQETGKCLPIIVNPDLECDETQAPVCGLIGNNKNGYLNECYAQRFGAVVISDGFCKPDPNILNNCDARTYSIGNCQQSFMGAWVNPESGSCEDVTMVGCGADIPFESVESCQEACG